MKTDHSSFILLLRQLLDFFLSLYVNTGTPLRKHPPDEEMKTNLPSMESNLLCDVLRKIRGTNQGAVGKHNIHLPKMKRPFQSTLKRVILQDIFNGSRP